MLISFYAFHHVILIRRKTSFSKILLPFILCISYFSFQEFGLNLFQLVSLNYNIFHQTWRAFSALTKSFIYMMGIYVMFRCFIEYRQISLKGFAIGTDFLAIMLLLTGRFIYEDDLPGLSFMGESLNINSIAAFFLQFLYVNFFAYKSSRKFLHRLFYGIFTITCLVVVFISQSRTSTGALIIGLGLVLLIKKPKITLSIALIGLLILAFILTGGNELNELTSVLPKRYSVERVSQAFSSGATNRTKVWHDYLVNASNRTLITGEGLGSYYNVLYQKPLTVLKYGKAGDDTISLFYPHNSYIAVFLELGGFGFIIYCLTLTKITLRLFHGLINKKIYWAYFSMYITFLIWGCFEGNFLRDMFILFTPLALSEIYKARKIKTGKFMLQEFYAILYKNKALIFKFVAFTSMGAFFYCSYADKIYKADCMLSFSDNNINFEMTMNRIAGVLRDDYIAGKIINKFNLMEVYAKKSRSETIKYFINNIIHAVSSQKGNLITISILDKDPERAAKILDFAVTETITRLKELSAQENAPKIMICNNEIERRKTKLIEAENNFAKYQKENDIILANSQLKNIISRVTSLRESIIDLDIELSIMKKFSSSMNSKMRTLEARLEAMHSELENISYSGNISAAIIGYRHKLRDIVLAEKMYIDAVKFLQRLKLSPNENLPTLKYIEHVMLPEDLFKPYMPAVIITASFCGLSLALLIIILKMCILDKNLSHM